MRVLRGGSWNNNQDNARASNRNNNNPNNRNNNNGFRLVVRPTSKANFHKAAGVHLLASRPGSITGERLPELTGVHGSRSEAEETQRRRGLVPSARVRARRANTESRRDLAGYPACHASLLSDLRTCLIHPPNSFPTSATIWLTWLYCPLFSQCQ